MRADADQTITINRAPVLALWAAVVAERLGFSRDEALSLGRAVTGLNAQAKGRHLGIYHQREPQASSDKAPTRRAGRAVELMGREIPVMKTAEGLRAVSKGAPVSAESAERYLQTKFGPDLERVRRAMGELAGAFEPADLGRRAFALYEKFRPNIPPGVKGWGAKGRLELALMRRLAQRSQPGTSTWRA
jgi:hypothetical protein